MQNEVEMIQRGFIHSSSHACSTGFSTFKITHNPNVAPPLPFLTALPFIRRFKCINGPEPSRMILALFLMKTLCGWIPAQQSGPLASGAIGPGNMPIRKSPMWRHAESFSHPVLPCALHCLNKALSREEPRRKSWNMSTRSQQRLSQTVVLMSLGVSKVSGLVRDVWSSDSSSGWPFYYTKCSEIAGEWGVIFSENGWHSNHILLVLYLVWQTSKRAKLTFQLPCTISST